MALLPLEINSSRLMEKIDRLAAFSDAPAPAVTRILFTPTEKAARAFIRQEIRDAGLSLREDGIGNIFGRWEGQNLELPAVATGSHIDAVPFSGRFDGTVGVLGALEAIRALKETGFNPERSLECIMFTAETPTRFGVGCLGSRALAGSLSTAELTSMVDEEGHSLETLRHAAGYRAPLAEVAQKPGRYKAFLELHIEQGPRLDQENIPIGVVTSIAAPASLKVSIIGEGGHAGSMLMAGRRDALAAASELILVVEKAPASTGRRDSVATVGRLNIHPGGVNSIPSRVELDIDVRDIAQAPRDSMVAFIRAGLEKIAARRNVEASLKVIHADPPCQAGKPVLAAIHKVCDQLHLPYLDLVSRPYHDTLFMSQICPAGMIFIPSRGGISHRPEEYSSPQQIERGVEVLAHTLVELSKGEKS